MANFGPLMAEVGWRVWGTPANFNSFAFWLCYCTDVAENGALFSVPRLHQSEIFVI